MNQHVINNLDFAKKNQLLEGVLSATDCQRLSPLLALDTLSSLSIQYQIQGDAGAMTLPALTLRIEAHLPVLCQRCLKPMTFDLSLNYRYVISDNAEEEDANADEVDFIEPDRAMNLIDLIEDEVIAALPIAPVHDTLCGDLHRHENKKESPFAVLKGLKHN